jgi:hypothetical protein
MTLRASSSAIVERRRDPYRELERATAFDQANEVVDVPQLAVLLG